MKYRTGLTHAYKSNICRSATFSERIPPPTGVVSGPLMLTRKSRAASTVSSGSHCWNVLNAFVGLLHGRVQPSVEKWEENLLL